jgi:hypothetical protein
MEEEKPADPTPSPASEKKKRKVDPTQANKTLDTQASIQNPGISANRAPAMGVYLRYSPDERRKCNASVQKPKGVSLQDWEAVSVDDRTPWILYHKLAIRDRKLTPAQYPFESFKATLEDEENNLLVKKELLEEKLKEKEKDMMVKLNFDARMVDRHLNTAVDNAVGRTVVLQSVAKKDLDKQIKDEVVTNVEDHDSENDSE